MKPTRLSNLQGPGQRQKKTLNMMQTSYVKPVAPEIAEYLKIAETPPKDFVRPVSDLVYGQSRLKIKAQKKEKKKPKFLFAVFATFVKMKRERPSTNHPTFRILQHWNL